MTGQVLAAAVTLGAFAAFVLLLAAALGVPGLCARLRRAARYRVTRRPLRAVSPAPGEPPAACQRPAGPVMGGGGTGEGTEALRSAGGWLP